MVGEDGEAKETKETKMKKKKPWLRTAAVCMLRAGRSDAAAASAVGEASLQTTIQIFATFSFFLAFRFRKKKKKKRRARKGCVATYEVAVAARLESDGPSRERGNGRKGKKKKNVAPQNRRPNRGLRRCFVVSCRRRGSRSMRASGVANPSGLLKACAVPRWVKKSERTASARFGRLLKRINAV